MHTFPHPDKIVDLYTTEIYEWDMLYCVITKVCVLSWNGFSYSSCFMLKHTDTFVMLFDTSLLLGIHLNYITCPVEGTFIKMPSSTSFLSPTSLRRLCHVKFLMVLVCLCNCLSLFWQHYSKSYERIAINFYGVVFYGSGGWGVGGARDCKRNTWLFWW